MGNDNVVGVWALATSAPTRNPLTGHTGPISVVATAVLPDGRLVAVTGGDDGTVRMWDVATGAPVGSPLTAAHTNPIGALATAVLPDGRTIVATSSTGRKRGLGPGHRHPDRGSPDRPHLRGGHCVCPTAAPWLSPSTTV